MLVKQQFFSLGHLDKGLKYSNCAQNTENIISNEKSGGFVRRFLARFPLSS